MNLRVWLPAVRIAAWYLATKRGMRGWKNLLVFCAPSQE